MTFTCSKDVTSLKAQITEKEAAIHAKRQAHARVLRTLLECIPKVNREVIPKAVDSLMNAAGTYIASMPLVDAEDQRSRPGIAEARASLLALHKAFCTAEKLLDNLPLNAMMALTDANDSSLGELKYDFERLLLTIETARHLVLSEPDKPKDAYRAVLAYEVAVVFVDILKIPPSSTSKKQLTENKYTARGGAIYARVLDATLKAAGVANCDLGPLILEGRRLLKDQHLPPRRVKLPVIRRRS
jgi:hypothetical protein